MTNAGEQYKFKKGDDLDKVAKAHGLKGADAIWKAPANKAVAAKRKDPSHLEAGDVLVIPADPKDAHADGAKFLEFCKAEIPRTKQKIATYDHLIDMCHKNTAASIQLLGNTKRHVEQAAEGADLAKDLATLGISLSKIHALSAKIAKAKGAEAIKLTQEMEKELASLKKEKQQDDAIKAVAKSAPSTSTVGIFVQSLAQSWDDMQTPSFWANTMVQLKAGKSWSEAVTTKLPDEIQGYADQIQSQSDTQVRQIETRKKEAVVHLALIMKEEKQTEAKMKGAH